MSQKPYTTAEFIRDFNKLAPHKHRYDVFRDFVTVSAISIYNVSVQIFLLWHFIMNK